MKKRKKHKLKRKILITLNIIACIAVLYGVCYVDIGKLLLGSIVSGLGLGWLWLFVYANRDSDFIDW